MEFETLVAVRYLFSKKRQGFVSVISLISVLGITIGVAALVAVLSVFNGFGGLVTSILVSFDPHLRVERAARSDPSAYASLIRYLDSSNAVKGYSPFVVGKALVVSRNVNRVVNIKGIDQARIGDASGLREKIVLGSLDFGGEGKNGIVLGMILADRLGAVVGDTVSIVSPTAAELASSQLGLPLIRRFRVVGLYETNNKDYDGYYAFTSVQSAEALFDAGKSIDGLEIRLNDIANSNSMRRRLASAFPDFRILTWFDLHRELYTVMQLERWAAYIILSLIIAVASFNLLGSLTMTVIEKTRDIGILKSMGATNLAVRRIFLYQGLLVGVVGTVAGIALGVLVVILQQKYHLLTLDPTVYIISAIPVELRLTDFIFIALAAVGLATFASRLPARRAADLIPAESIRWE